MEKKNERRAREVRSAGLCLASFGAACTYDGMVVASTHPVNGYGVGAESLCSRGFGAASGDGERGSCAGGRGRGGERSRRGIRGDTAVEERERERERRKTKKHTNTLHASSKCKMLK